MCKNFSLLETRQIYIGKKKKATEEDTVTCVLFSQNHFSIKKVAR